MARVPIGLHVASLLEKNVNIIKNILRHCGGSRTVMGNNRGYNTKKVGQSIPRKILVLTKRSNKYSDGVLNVILPWYHELLKGLTLF